MKKSTNEFFAVLGLLLVEVYFFIKGVSVSGTFTSMADFFFTWGLIELLLSLTLIFGFENKMINNAFTKSGNENYIQNTSNFIAASSKNFFKRETDMGAGVKIMILAIVNLVLYALSLLL